MTNFKHILEKGSKKHVCVSCGKRSAVRYIDLETNEYLPSKYSRCDREMKCGYWVRPEGDNLINSSFVPTPPKASTLLPIHYVNITLKKYNQNSFVTYLKTILKPDEVNNIIQKYRIGTYFRTGAVIFWQIDLNEKVHYGKIMSYDEVTGRRKKEQGSTKSVFKELKKSGKIKEYNIEQCFFGLHLANTYPEKIIAITESEKTACVMSQLYPSYLWMASTALSHLQEFKFKPIKDRKIILYPDLGIDRNGISAFEKWSAKAKEYNSKGYDIEVSKVLENISTQKGIKNGYDILDYFLENREKEETPANNQPEKPLKETESDKDFSLVTTRIRERIENQQIKGDNPIINQEPDKEDIFKNEVKELEDFINSVSNLPKELSVNPGYKILDVEKFFKSHLQIVKSQIGNNSYAPYLKRLNEAKREILNE